MDNGRVIVREIKVSTRVVADSLLGLLNSGIDFSLLAQQNSSTNPSGGGLYGPLSRNDDRYVFDAASLLDVGGYSPVLSKSKNIFSIVQLVEHVPAAPLDIEHVFVQIESLLIKEEQERAKLVGVDGLLNKYVVIKNNNILF